jgi:hypothetical protein
MQGTNSDESIAKPSTMFIFNVHFKSGHLREGAGLPSELRVQRRRKKMHQIEATEGSISKSHYPMWDVALLHIRSSTYARASHGGELLITTTSGCSRMNQFFVEIAFCFQSDSFGRYSASRWAHAIHLNNSYASLFCRAGAGACLGKRIGRPHIKVSISIRS